MDPGLKLTSCKTKTTTKQKMNVMNIYYPSLLYTSYLNRDR